MNDDSYPPDVVGIVRRYSATVAETMPDNTLAQAVTAVEIDNQELDNQEAAWRQWLRFDVPETDSDAVKLQVQAREAAELWRKLKLDIGATELHDSGPPTIATLWKAVEDASIQWDKKREKGFGKAKLQIFSFLETMEAHKYLFSVIPNGDKYTCLLTGVVTTVVKASVAHEQIAEGFSRALQDISKDLDFVRRGIQICDTSEVKRHVLALYGEVFAFLCHAMKWYSSSWNRFRKSFDGRFYDTHLEQRVKGIQTLVRRVHDEMKLGTDRLVQVIHAEQSRGFLGTNTHIATRFDRFDREMDMKLKAFARLVGEQMRMTLMANAQHDLDVRSKQLAIEGLESVVPMVAAKSGFNDSISKVELEQYVQLIAPCAENGKGDIALDSTSTRLPVIPSEVISDIQKWVESRDSKLLWVEGPVFGPFDDVLSSVGLRVCTIAEGVGVPCVSFFAKRKYTFPPQDMSVHEAGLIAMLYSLVSQLVDVIPPTFHPATSLTGGEFRKLDGTIQSVQAALGILKALVSVAAPGLICVISGFDLVDSRENLGPLVDMIEIFRDQPPEKTVKVLFITMGNCRSLSKATSMNQRSDATRMVLATRFSPLPGGAVAHNIKAVNESQQATRPTNKGQERE